MFKLQKFESLLSGIWDITSSFNLVQLLSQIAQDLGLIPIAPPLIFLALGVGFIDLPSKSASTGCLSPGKFLKNYKKIKKAFLTV